MSLLVFSCNPSKYTHINPDEVTFKTDEASKLFFKNVRKNYYDLEELPEAKLEVYRFKKRLLSEEKPLLDIALVNNWRYDEAYILIEPNAAAGVLNDLYLRWTNDQTQEQGELRFEGGNKKAHLLFAGKVYDLLLRNCRLELNKQEQWLPILTDQKEKEAFRITMFDYYRLTNQL